MANRTQFARQYRAVDFNYGGLGPDVPPGLVVASAPGASGSQTLTLYGSTITLTDGTIVSPLATTASVTVVNASGSDTQTPTAVSTYVQSNVYGLTATVTATWTYAHYQGDRVSSGTVGLQEAINYANSKGGGSVIVDEDWVAQGGTQAILAAATWPGGVTLIDNRLGVGPLKTTYTLTNAQILALSSTPVLLLPAPGAGYFYNILKATIVNENTGTAYTGSMGVTTIGYSSSPIQALSGTIAASFFTVPTTTQVIQLAGSNLASTTEAQYDNQPIYISTATANPATGTGTLKISLAYTIEAK